MSIHTISSLQSQLIDPYQQRNNLFQHQKDETIPGKSGGSDHYTPATPQQQLNQINSLLNRHIQSMPVQPLESLDPQEFTPQKITDRILGFVESGVNKARSEGADVKEIDKMIKEAKDGIKEGFKEAKEILKEMGLFSGEVKENYKSTFNQVMDGLDEMRTSRPEKPALPENSQVEAFQHLSLQQSRSISMSLTTKDGDQVTIEINRSMAADSAEYGRMGGGNFSYISEQRLEQQASFSYSVEGDLDADEMEAIKELTQDIEKVAREFFSGDSEEALDLAGEIELDSELSGYRVNMQEQQQFSAVATYQEINRQGSDQGILSQLAQFFPANMNPQQFDRATQQLEGISQRLGAQHLFSQQEQIVAQLFSSRLEIENPEVNLPPISQLGDTPELTTSVMV